MGHHKTLATDDQSRVKEKSEPEEVNSEKSSGLFTDHLEQCDFVKEIDTE